jgi:GTPase SAR1 family protein
VARYNAASSIANKLRIARRTNTLDLSSRKLTVVPPEIGELGQLKTLDLSNNQISRLPPEIGNLTRLESLNLVGNQLSGLPPEIGKLVRLQSLNLRNNRLTTLPPEIGQLSSLLTLWLDSNELAELPPEIGQLKGLMTIWPSDNRLTALPPEIGHLTRLTALPLARNRLTTLPPEIAQLDDLHQVWLGGNQFTELPPEIFHLTELNDLGLEDNQLTTLPPEIGQLNNLQKLDLSNNQLTELPKELAGLLEGGLITQLQGNPLRDPVPELIGRGSGALANYLHSLDDAVPQFEAKVLLVGEGNVGKTSLVAALREAPFIEGRLTTHGIEIQPLITWQETIGANMTLRFWDFGGQEVYRITHQFFFSMRALYLVVWNAREGQEQNEVEGWLRRIKLRVSQDAIALVVATHCDERRPELNYPQLERLFPELLDGRYDVDNSSGNGIAELLTGITKQAARLPQMGQLISRRWIAARDEILVLARTEPQIPYEHFAEICQRHNVSSDEVVTLLELMHDLGQIVYFGDDEGLRDFVVLNPEWLTKAISYVLEDQTTRQSAGILEHARLAEIWQNRKNDLTYPKRYHRYFLRLMEKFDVSYRLEDDEYRSLVAQLVPHDRPDLPWDTDITPPDGIRSLALVCHLSEPVPGLIAWLTVQHHRSSAGRHWRDGVFLRHPIAAYASEALVELRTQTQLAVDVRAPSPDMFFNVLRDSVEDLITRRWPGLDYSLYVPCSTRTDEGARCPGQVPLKFLLGYREHGGMRTACHECLVERDVSELLTGFAHPDLPLQPELERLHDRLTDVASGVNRLEGYAAETADSVRRVLRVVGSEVIDCPRLFTLVPERSTGMRRWKFYTRHYRLTLWCEHSGYWHPWSAASYPIDQPKSWLVRVGPYASLVFRALRLVAPIAGSVAGVVLTEDQLKHAEHEIELMKTLISSLPDQIPADQDELVERGLESKLTVAQGQALRAVRVLLFEHDRMRSFGDLRRVQAPSGDVLWVCPGHYTDYDPGLPVIPDSVGT